MNGMHANGVRLTPNGEVSWLVGNLGDIPVVTLDYRTYRAVGWTIDAREDVGQTDDAAATRWRSLATAS